MLTDAQRRVLTFLVELLRENSIQFQVTGGLAAIAYGAHRPLYDIDLDLYEKDVPRVRELLQTYITEDWNNDLEGPEDEFDLWMMKLEIEGIPVDISQIEGARIRSIRGDWVNQPSTMNTEIRTVEGIKIPVQNKEDLVAYKIIIGRDTDLEDVQQIQ